MMEKNFHESFDEFPRPSAIDALIFGHMKAITNCPYSTKLLNRLVSTVHGFPDLLRLARNISKRFFNDDLDDGLFESDDCESLRRTSSSSSSTNDEESSVTLDEYSFEIV